MTYGDFIRSMPDKELAVLFWSLIHELDVQAVERLHAAGVPAELIEIPAASVESHLEWLQSEMEDGDE